MFNNWNRTKILVKVILNSTEWEVIVDYKDYEASMRFEGRVSFKPYLESFKLIESQRKDSWSPKGVFIRITDMPQKPYDLCKHAESLFTYFDGDESVNEERWFFQESWRFGKVIRQLMISLRYYQVSQTETQS